MANTDCGIARALGVFGDCWGLLIVRDIAGGTTRFDALQYELGISRRVLAERLSQLVEHGVLHRRAYSEHPPRFDYLLTTKGEGLLPVLIALQDWGTRYLLGGGDLTATADPAGAETRRVLDLVGRRLPEVLLTRHDGAAVPPAAPGAWTVLYLFPGAMGPGAQDAPPGWTDIPGAVGCTVESTTYASFNAEFASLGVRVHGISTQRPYQLAAFAARVELPFPLLSDQDGRLAAGLLLPTFRVGGVDRLKRLSLLVDPDAVIRAVQFPITDPAGSVTEMLGLIRSQPAEGGVPA
jgi:DNA-binding HxlR family transcriptional regulator/peroxiredoxin